MGGVVIMKNVRSARQAESFKAMLGPIWKAVAVATILTIALILLFALTMKLGITKEGAIPVVNQLIKILGVLMAAFFATRKEGRKVMRAVLAGVMFIILGIVLFSLLDGRFVFTVSLIWDLLMGALIGLLSGMLFVRMQKK